MNLHKQQFLEQHGDPSWLEGLDHIPAKLRAIYDINKILAHRPWLLNKEHIEVCNLIINQLNMNLNIVHSSFIFVLFLFSLIALIQKLTRGPNNWSLSEIVHAIVLLTHIHSLSSFVFSCGLTQDLDPLSSQRTNTTNNNKDQLKDGENIASADRWHLQNRTNTNSSLLGIVDNLT